MANLFSITIGWLCVHFYWRGVHILSAKYVIYRNEVRMRNCIIKIILNSLLKKYFIEH